VIREEAEEDVDDEAFAEFLAGQIGDEAGLAGEADRGRARDAAIDADQIMQAVTLEAAGGGHQDLVGAAGEQVRRKGDAPGVVLEFEEV
jgi:hypothetical protein